MMWPLLIHLLKQRLQQPLPGSLAHEPLRSIPIGPLKPNFDHAQPPKPGSVMILLYPDGDQIKFPLTKRHEYHGAHGGQISLPGGKTEIGETSIETALRETEEEIGVQAHQIKVVGQLSQFFVMPSNYLVIPVVGFMDHRPVYQAQQSEVVRIIEGRLSSLIQPDAVRTKEIIAAKIYPMQAPHFEIEGEVVWGATAMILNELRVLVKELVAT